MARTPFSREQWTSRAGFILAATGSAVGLGNVWRFPYLAGTHGGAAFLSMYLLATVFMGIPLLLGELALGSHTRRPPCGAFEKIAPGTPWRMVGMLTPLVGFLVLSFYASVAGWTLAYAVRSVVGLEAVLGPDRARAAFDEFLNSPGEVLSWQLVTMALTAYATSRGIASGIEKACRVMVPALVAMEVFLAVRAASLPGALEALRFYLSPHFEDLTPAAVLAAVGQCFFSLNVGSGQSLIYASYLPPDEPILGSALWIAAADTAVAFLAGLIVFPAAFSMGVQPHEGPGLVFVTLPSVMARMPAGQFLCALFFVLLFLAAFTSTLALLESVVSHAVDEAGWSRAASSWFAAALAFLFGIPCSLSVGPWRESTILLGLNFFELIDFLTCSVFLPAGAILYSAFCVFRWGTEPALDAIGVSTEPFISAWWKLCMSFVVPVGCFAILLNELRTRI